MEGTLGPFTIVTPFPSRPSSSCFSSLQDEKLVGFLKRKKLVKAWDSLHCIYPQRFLFFTLIYLQLPAISHNYQGTIPASLVHQKLPFQESKSWLLSLTRFTSRHGFRSVGSSCGLKPNKVSDIFSLWCFFIVRKKIYIDFQIPGCQLNLIFLVFIVAFYKLKFYFCIFHMKVKTLCDFENWLKSDIGWRNKIYTWVYLVDTAGSVPDNCNKAHNIKPNSRTCTQSKLFL